VGGCGDGMLFLLLLEVMVMDVEVCITVDQLHDRFLCSSLPMTLESNFFTLVGALDCWNAPFCCIVNH